mmetsp:Transcript_46036/g.112413  ORF Transcript_46036/g.112413 Transcript_46036/m.112413 type:complete len:836 (+) Transcript_46036:444-2951(+)
MIKAIPTTLILLAVASQVFAAGSSSNSNLRSNNNNNNSRRKYHFSTHTYSEANRYLHGKRVEQRKRQVEARRQHQDSQQQREQQHQRRRDAASEASPFLPGKSAVTQLDDEWVYIMAECQPEEDWKACVTRIEACDNEGTSATANGTGDTSTLSALRYMHSIHTVAVTTKTTNLECLGQTEEDPIRQPFHIPESLQIIDDITSVVDNEEMMTSQGRHGDRLLQSNQLMPYGVDLLRAPDVWEQFGTKGEGVIVCVLDSGVEASHPDLDVVGYEGFELVQPWDEDNQSGHGTHVTGTVSASDNGFGIVGVAPGAEVIFGRVFDDDGFFHSSDIIAGLEACRDSGASVVNLSLGGPGMSRREQIMMESFFENDNIVTVAATGNSGNFELNFPAAYDYVVGVAAVDRDGNRAQFSTRNAKIDVAAPGVNVASTYPGGRYAYLSGTSMSSPHVAGVVALMLSVAPNSSPIDIFLALRATAVKEGEPDTSLGFGIVDALAAVQEISGQNPSPVVTTPVPAPAPVVTVPVSSPNDGNGRISAQYVVTMQHYTDQIQGVDNQPGGFPLVRYMCKGNFEVISSSRAIRENSQNIDCSEIADEDGYTGWECLHQCGPSLDSCGYWWNNDNNNVGVGWDEAAVWFECSGEDETDTQAKFVWLNNGGFDLTVPAGTGASNGKVARLAVRTDYSEPDVDLISQDRLPPVDVTADRMILGEDVNFRSDRAPDGGYYGWTGVSGCTGNCFVTYDDMEFQSDPSLFPNSFFQQFQPESDPVPSTREVPAASPSEAASSAGLGSDTGSKISIPVSQDGVETINDGTSSSAVTIGLACTSVLAGIFTSVLLL